MKNRSVFVLSAIAGAALSTGLAVSAENTAENISCGVAQASEQDQRMLASMLLPMMPREHREAIINAGGIGSEVYTAQRNRDGAVLVSHDDRYESLREFVSPALFARIDDKLLDAMLSSRDRAESGDTPAKMCFAPGTDPEIVAAFSAMFQEEMWNGEEDGTRFQIGGRWTATATDGFGTGTTGDPITLTYSFVPDGTTIPNSGFGSGPSNLFSWLNGLYGSTTTWQNLFHLVFDRWGELTGVNYVHETNDDGVTHSFFGGSIGTRGDVRIGAKFLDGGSGVLAYNFFPNDGDMVIDSGDSFYNSTSSNSRRLRNVVAHEHGHGLGFEHVCPANGTKLMEPFATTGYDGPQLDDILAGQRNYGDPNEPNDVASDATDLGNWFIGRNDTYDDISVDDNSDTDFFEINATQNMEIVVDITPDAATYQQGPQTGSCNTGTTTNYNTKQDLRVAIRASNGTTTLLTVDDTSEGFAEQLRYTITTPGTFFIVVDDSSNNNSIQRYKMDVAGEPVPFDGPTIVAQQTAPAVVLPGTPVNLDFEVLANADTIVDGPDLHYRFDGGAFITSAMSPVGGNIFRAAIPAAACGDSPEYYISVEGSFVGDVNLPLAGPSDPFSYDLGEFQAFFEDDFEQDNGWNDSISTASAGEWDRGVPVASTGAPPTDFDGSGQCYVTGNTAGEDVDFGRVFLSTPGLDMENGGRFSYAYWLSGGGTPLDGDTMKVEISTNGQITWATLRTYSDDTAGWLTDSIDIDSATGVSNTRFRFIVEDAGANNTVEGAVDAISVGEIVCEEPQGCNAADVAEPFGILDLNDINVFISGFLAQDPVADIAAPFGVFDLADIALFTSEFLAGCP